MGFGMMLAEGRLETHANCADVQRGNFDPWVASFSTQAPQRAANKSLKRDLLARPASLMHGPQQP